MKIKLLKNPAFFVLLVFTACEIGEDSPKREFYSFEEEVALSPVKKVYSQGDIFFMEVDIPGKTLKDVITGKEVEVGNATFNVTLEVFDPFVSQPDLEKFELIPQTGEISGDDNFEKDGKAVLSFGCPASNYVMKNGIQFKEKGGYLVYLNRGNPYFQIVFTQDSDCSIIQPNQIPPDEADIATVHMTFDSEDTNKDKFEEYAALFPSSGVGLDSIRSSLDKREAFFVWVK